MSEYDKKCNCDECRSERLRKPLEILREEDIQFLKELTETGHGSYRTTPYETIYDASKPKASRLHNQARIWAEHLRVRVGE